MTVLTTEELYRVNDGLTFLLATLGWRPRSDADDETFFPLRAVKEEA